MAATTKKVAVLGGGIVGISSALAVIQQNPNVKVTVFSELFTPDTTGDGAAGLWMPYLMGEGTLQNTALWAKESFTFLQELFLHEPEAGVTLMSGYVFDIKDPMKDFWKDTVYGYAPMSQEELNLVGGTEGVKFTTFITECTKLLPFLMKNLESFGCVFIKKKVESLEELANEFDVIVNCPGVMARHLANDPKVKPIRGQIMKVHAPWMKMFILNEENYIIPNQDFVVLGGTHQEENWSQEVNGFDRNHILSGCSKIVPSLKKAKVLTEWVGLRPGRSEIRLEVEKIGHKNVVHNYGHGGAGVTMFWGCARQAARLVSTIFAENLTCSHL